MRPSLILVLGILVGFAWCSLVAVIARESSGRSGRLAERLFFWTSGLAPLSTVLLPRAASLAGYGNVTTFSREFTIASQGAAAVVLAGSVLAIWAGGRTEDEPGRSSSSSAKAIWVWSLALGVAYLVSGAFGSVPQLDAGMISFPFAVTAVYCLRSADADRIAGYVWNIAMVWVVGSLLSMAVNPAWATATSGISQTDTSFLGRSLRLRGLTDHPNELAMIALQGAILSAYQARRYARVGGFLLSAITVVLTGSRTPLFALALCLLVIWYFGSAGRRSVHARLAALLIAVASLGGVAFGAADVPLLADNNFTSGVSTLQGRTDVWRITIEEWQSNPLVGYGPTLWSAEYRMSRSFNSFSWVGQAHNQLLDTLGIAGLLGVFALAGLSLALARAAWRRRLLDRGMALALLTAVALNSVTERTIAMASFPTPLFPMLAVVAIAVARSMAGPGPDGADRDRANCVSNFERTSPALEPQRRV